MKTVKINIMTTDGAAAPTYATDGSAGCDLAANNENEILICPGDIVMVPTGLKMNIPEGYEAQIRSRSGMTLKHGIVVANGVGTIDSDYTGEICVILTNISRENYTVKKGERIAQMVISRCERAEFTPVEAIAQTKRGEGGFGSTGK